MAQTIRNRTAVILLNESNEVLMVPHFVDGRISHWYLPGGGVEFLESVEDAAVREFEEETGLRIEAAENLGYVEFRRETDPWHCITFVFLGKYSSGEIRTEKSTFGEKTPRWFSKASLPENTVPYLRDVIEAQLDGLDT